MRRCVPLAWAACMACSGIPDPSYETGASSTTQVGTTGTTAVDTASDGSQSSDSMSVDGSSDTSTIDDCGNDLIEAGEVCDGADLGGQTCMARGFVSGELTCLPDCSGFDHSGCLMCGDTPPTVDGECPPQCNSCTTDTCMIDCTGDQVCAEQSITCPDGWHCEVICDGNQACQRAEIVCSAQHACSVECNLQQACHDATVTCGDGPCALQCGDDEQECQGLQFTCGPNDGMVMCSGDQEGFPAPSPFPRSGCDCTETGCNR